MHVSIAQLRKRITVAKALGLRTAKFHINNEYFTALFVEARVTSRKPYEFGFVVLHFSSVHLFVTISTIKSLHCYVDIHSCPSSTTNQLCSLLTLSVAAATVRCVFSSFFLFVKRNGSNLLFALSYLKIILQRCPRLHIRQTSLLVTFSYIWI